jgi:hypothetical protein
VSDRLRVALLDHAHERGSASDRLAAALRDAGHEPVLLTDLRELAAAPLRLRKIGDHLGHLPAALLALRRGGHEVAHAFTPSDALAAIAWSRRSGRPALFTCTDPPRRETIAGRRLRLATWRRAVHQSAAVLAGSEEVAAGLERWLAADAQVLDPGDAEAHVEAYLRCST